jgi:hypothetical protein
MWATRHSGTTQSDPATWQWRTDDDDWVSSQLLHRCTLWAISPTTARQAMSSAALSWMESPLDSEHPFVVPRIHQRDFGRVNKHIVYVGQFDPNSVFSE